MKSLQGETKGAGIMKRVGNTTIGEFLGSTIAFTAVTLGLVAVIAFCMVGTVVSQTDIGARELENYYREQEKVLLQEAKEYLTELGFQNSGVTLTRVVDEEGKRDYTFTIHHGKIDRMSEEERAKLAELLLTRVVLDENCTFYHEFLLYE